MLKELVKLANHLDQKGLTREADFLDSIIKNASESDKSESDKSESDKSESDKFIFLMPETDSPHIRYLYELIIGKASELKGASNIFRANKVEEFFKDNAEIANFIHDLGANTSAKISKKIEDFCFVSTKMMKEPNGKYKIFFEAHLNGIRIADAGKSLAGMNDGQKSDGTHLSDEQVKKALKELFNEVAGRMI